MAEISEISQHDVWMVMRLRELAQGLRQKADAMDAAASAIGDAIPQPREMGPIYSHIDADGKLVYRRPVIVPAREPTAPTDTAGCDGKPWPDSDVDPEPSRVETLPPIPGLDDSDRTRPTITKPSETLAKAYSAAAPPQPPPVLSKEPQQPASPAYRRVLKYMADACKTDVPIAAANRTTSDVKNATMLATNNQAYQHLYGLQRKGWVEPLAAGYWRITKEGLAEVRKAG